MSEASATKPIDLALVLDLLAEVELAMARLYDWLAEVLEDVEARELFAQLGREELGHRDLVRFQQQLVRKSRGMFQPVVADAASLRQAVAAAATFREDHPKPTLAQALAFALRVESDAAETRYRTVIAESNPAMARLISSLGKADEEHGVRLRAFAERRGAG